MKIIKFIAFAFYIFSFTSCQDVIIVNLNSSAPQYVIEGLVTDQAGPYSVKITKTTDFFVPQSDTSFVSGAFVTIADDTGVLDTLNEKQKGIYLTKKTIGKSGTTYTLKVSTGGNVFTAINKMPRHVNLDSLELKKSTTPFSKNNFQIFYDFTDPVGVGDNYRLRVTLNDTLKNNILLQSDSRVVGDGKKESIPIFGFNFTQGDRISVDLWSIDNIMYSYFNQLASANGSQNSAAPANPTSNFTGGALGYFAAVSVSTKSLTIK